MPSYVTPLRAIEFIFYDSLISQADTKLLQNSPTLAAGDFLVSTDGGATTNLDTLPTVTPASGDSIKITVSIAEMTGDNIKIVASDAAGAEWCDRSWNIQTSVRQIDDLAFPSVSGRSFVVETDGMIHGDTKEWLGVAPLALIAQRVAANAGVVSDKTGYALSAAGTLAIWHEAVANIVTASTIGKLLIDEITAVRMAVLTDWIDAGRLDLLLDAIKAVTDLLPNAGALSDLALIKTEADKIALADAGAGVAGSVIEEVENRATPAQVATELNTENATDTVTLPGQEAPPLAPTRDEMISWLYKVLRNRKDQTSTLWQLYADDESTVDAKATVSDDATTAIKQEIITGP